MVDSDEVPEWVRDRARALFDQHEPDLPVADLVSDSLLADEPSPMHQRTLVFARVEQQVVIMVAGADGDAEVAVAVSPAGTYDVVARVRDDADYPFSTDGAGRARVRRPVSGLTSLLVQPAGAPERAWRTAWVKW